MDINEVQSFIEQNKDSDEVKSFVNGLNPITPDRVKSLVGEDKDLKSWFDSEKDKHLSKGIDTFKSNNVPKLVDEEVKKRFPDADPKDVEMKKLQAQLDKMQADSTRKDLTNKTLKAFQEKKLPSELVDFLIGADEEVTSKNVEMLAKLFAAHDEAIKTEFAKSNSYTPPKDKGDLGKEEETARAEIAKYMHK
jgi:hypothetical protein